jgi:predicted secreted protein
MATGSNVITVTAHDAAGNTATDSITVAYSAADTTPPTLSIDTPTTSSTYAATSTPLSIGGSASDNVAVTQVTWSNAGTGGAGTATGTSSWSASVALASGSNVIAVTAHDAAGNTATDSITVTYTPPAGDTTAPSISILSPTAGSAFTTGTDPVVLSGSASDNAGVTTVTWSNAATGQSGSATGTSPWDASIALSAGSNVITVTAYDAAGNTASDSITVSYVSGGTTPPPGGSDHANGNNGFNDRCGSSMLATRPGPGAAWPALVLALALLWVRRKA